MKVAVGVVEWIVAGEIEAAESGLGGVVVFGVLADEALLVLILLVFGFMFVEGAALSFDFIICSYCLIDESFFVVVFFIVERGENILDLDVDLVHILKFVLVDLPDF